MKKEIDTSEITALIFVVWIVLAWLTHISVCFNNGSWGFLIAGAIFVPIAWLHGTGIWLGLW